MEEYQEHSLGGRVFQKLRDDILSGKYKEHDELRETTLGKELGVSRTPVRAALRQLELEGLVTIIPNKGAYVTGISQKDIRDIYVIRSMLEGLCARWAAQHITEEQLDELRSEEGRRKIQENLKQFEEQVQDVINRMVGEDSHSASAQQGKRPPFPPGKMPSGHGFPFFSDN